jgi:hypothetical protein
VTLLPTASIVPAEFSGTILDLLPLDSARGDWRGAALEIMVLAICAGVVAWMAIRFYVGMKNRKK